MAGAIRKQAFYRENKNIFPNTYLIFVAPPGRFRKTYALELGLAVLKRIIPEIHFLPQDGSDVAFDEAMTDCRGYGISYHEELAGFLNLSGREHMSQMSVKFLQYFNPSMMPPKHRTKKEGEKKVPAGSVVTFASACVDDDFQRFMSSGAISSGQLSRCLVLAPTEEDARPEIDMAPPVPENFYHTLSSELSRLIPTKPIEVQFSKEAKYTIKDLSKEVLKWYKRNPHSILRRSTQRTLDLTKRMAVVHAISRGSGIIETQDIIRPFEDIINAYLRTVKYFIRFGIRETPDQRLRGDIMQRLDEYGRATDVFIARDLNESPEKVQVGLETLKKMGHAYPTVIDSVAVWRAYKPDEADDAGIVIKHRRAMDRFDRIMMEKQSANEKNGKHGKKTVEVFNAE